MLYRYVKAHPTTTPAITIGVAKLLPFSLMTIGIILISSVALPILYYELVTGPKLRRTAFLSPLPGAITDLQALSQVAGVSTPQASANQVTVDYTEVSNWFPTAPFVSPASSKITHYTLDIPKLNIRNAVVAIGGTNLKKTLIQYGGTANPGEYGTPVIFGHSVLPQFYNPSENNPNRYVSIFSTLMSLETGDEIYINFDGIAYTYKVSDKYIVEPTQVEVLIQRYDRRTLKLITCWPPGTYIGRGVVEAQLVKI